MVTLTSTGMQSHMTSYESLSSALQGGLQGDDSHGGLVEAAEPLSVQTISMRYEQLLMVQQRQFSLSMEHKEAELAHLKACFDVLEGRPQQASLEEALRSKDEEAALMMAAKHKELELMVGLLQLREQQIEELRCKCEEQQFQLGQLQEMRQSPGSASPAGRAEHSPSASSLVAPNSGKDDSSQMKREVRRLRLRMEELEATVGEQNERSAELARELGLKTERVEALEEHIQSHQPPAQAPNEHARPVVSRLFQEAEDGQAPASKEVSHNGSHMKLRPLFHEERPNSVFSVSPVAPWAEDVPESSAPSQLPTYRSAVRADRDAHEEWSSKFRHDALPSSPGPQDTSDAGKQSQELLREMRRLRMQMNELEQVAAGARSDPAAGMQTTPMAPQAPEVHSASSGGLGGRGREAPRWEDGQGARMYTEPVVAGMDSMRSPAHSSYVGKPATEGLWARSPDPLSLSDFAGWEYRPHTNDPTDEAVASLVNRPGGRYRGWRALLCRLESGLYLCGTRRVHLRADEQFDRIEASEDGSHWADLANMMRGAEASQHALLERAKGALGMST